MSYRIFIPLLLFSLISLQAFAQQHHLTDEWLKEYLKKEKEFARDDAAAVKKFSKGNAQPLLQRIDWYRLEEPYKNGSYNVYLTFRNWQKADSLIAVARAMNTGQYPSLERSLDDLDFRWVKKLNPNYFIQSERREAKLRELMAKEYSPEAFYLMAEWLSRGKYLYEKGNNDPEQRTLGTEKSFDSLFHYTQEAAQRGHLLAAQKLAGYRMFGDGNMWRRPTPATDRYRDTMSARIWYRIVHDSLWKTPAARNELYYYVAIYQDSTTDHALLELVESTPDPLQKGIELYNQKDYWQAYRYWMGAAKFRNQAAAFYNLALLKTNGLGVSKDLQDAVKLYDRAGDLGLLDGYYQAGYTSLLKMDGSNEHLTFFRKGAQAGHEESKQALVRLEKVRREQEAAAAEKERAASALSGKRLYEYDNTFKTKAGTRSSSGSRSSTCSACGGRGSIHTTIPGGAKNASGFTVFGETRTCLSCNGKGYN